MIRKSTVLVVEPDEAQRDDLVQRLEETGRVVRAASNLAEAAWFLDSNPIDIVLSNLDLPDGSAFELMSLPVHGPDFVFMTADQSIDHAIEALHHGAADFLLRPFTDEKLGDCLERIEARRRAETTIERRILTDRPPSDWRAQHAPEIMGSDPSLFRLFTVMERVSDSDCAVLITGESGTGKELFARALHRASPRRQKPFIALNCAAIPENLVESELFGHVRGAFTGASQSRPGRFAMADGGTIFLDEVGELPLAVQAKLLRVLQEKEILPVGDTRTQHVDVRVIAATNRDLYAMAEGGTFREDLLYRLDVIPLELPALRERRGDIPELVRHFIAKSSKKRNRPVHGISDAALRVLCDHEWRGNVRELENTIERMVLLCAGKVIDVEDVPKKIRKAIETREEEVSASPMLPEDGIDLRDAVEQYENALIRQALERTGWNKNRAAAILRMNRTTLVEKLKKKDLLSRLVG